jgi:uncharacterized protein YbcI
MLDAPHADAHEGQSVQMTVSNAMVKLYKEMFGRGPTKTRTSFAGPDLLVTTLENTLTPAERSLAAMGEHQRLRDTRMFFQDASENEFRGTVEQITGRKVRAFVSGIDTRHDVASELFYLEPESANGDGALPPEQLDRVTAS